MDRTTPPYDHISVLTALILIGIVLFLVVNVPTWTLAARPLGSPLTLNVSETWLVTLLLVALACTGTDSVIRCHPRSRAGELSYSFVFWILPGLVTLLAALLLPHAPSIQYWLVGLATTAALISLSVAVEYRTVDPADPAYRLARLGLNFTAYLIALGLFILIYASRGRSLITATATLAVGGLLALDLLRDTEQPMWRCILYAVIVGLLLGEAVWALNYWRASSFTVGGLLLLLLYIATGITQQHLQGNLDRRTLIEFATVGALGVIILLRYSP
ncbi:MAG: hypothetical protein SVX38_11340 [Chloroflexota bacterium]|nr:hypothetical protein [Chloroflexota bacterium]